MGLSINRGTPKQWIFLVKVIIFHGLLGTSINRHTHMEHPGFEDHFGSRLAAPGIRPAAPANRAECQRPAAALGQ